MAHGRIAEQPGYPSCDHCCQQSAFGTCNKSGKSRERYLRKPAAMSVAELDQMVNVVAETM